LDCMMVQSVIFEICKSIYCKIIIVCLSYINWVIVL
jgi:hypothetical protein